ncbi:hypothetical protein DFH08DRAFT_812395 [Mycena albidolilacea]|uniref:Uncharacterized protein n=1 Tax=Mycena albidolilacea TaxID=1033008 RepID=A0AAD7ENU1_9AGAR|nr:hypothetical protein DFH08DRAFT_812395 [Mycena albidolilacea]
MCSHEELEPRKGQSGDELCGVVEVGGGFLRWGFQCTVFIVPGCGGLRGNAAAEAVTGEITGIESHSGKCSAKSADEGFVLEGLAVQAFEEGCTPSTRKLCVELFDSVDGAGGFTRCGCNGEGDALEEGVIFGAREGEVDVCGIVEIGEELEGGAGKVERGVLSAANSDLARAKEAGVREAVGRIERGVAGNNTGLKLPECCKEGIGRVMGWTGLRSSRRGKRLMPRMRRCTMGVSQTAKGRSASTWRERTADRLSGGEDCSIIVVQAVEPAEIDEAMLARVVRCDGFGESGVLFIPPIWRRFEDGCWLRKGASSNMRGKEKREAALENAFSLDDNQTEEKEKSSRHVRARKWRRRVMVGVDRMESLVVDMENNVGAPELVAPAQDGVNNSQHFLDLHVMCSMATWAPDREPIGPQESPKTFGTTGVCVDVKDAALRGDETDAVPFHCKSGPPCDVTASGLGKATAGKRSLTSNIEPT